MLISSVFDYLDKLKEIFLGYKFSWIGFQIKVNVNF